MDCEDDLYVEYYYLSRFIQIKVYNGLVYTGRMYLSVRRVYSASREFLNKEVGSKSRIFSQPKESMSTCPVM